MRPVSVMLTVTWMTVVLASTGSAQFLYLDANGDGRNDRTDRLATAESTRVDIWLQTDKNADGSPALCRGPVDQPFTINSYEFILRSVGGTVEWGTYTNLQPRMRFHLGPLKNATDYYQYFGGLTSLPPGRYKLGTMTLNAQVGNPRIVLASSSSLWALAHTSFGSYCAGKDGDHTVRFTDDPTKLGSPVVELPGDWADASGLDAPRDAVQLAQAMSATLASFSVSISPNPANPEATIEVQTTKAGPLRVQIFDISGRLVRTVLNDRSAGTGKHSIRIPGRSGALPSGIYLYRVEAVERTVIGKIVILK